MNLYKVLEDNFSYENKSINELVKISALIDEEKNNNGFLKNNTDDLSVIASFIVALLNEESTQSVGEKLYAKLCDVIVEKNESAIMNSEGEKIYEEAQKKAFNSTYRVVKTRSGYIFQLVSSVGEILFSSDVYSLITSCTTGISSVQKNITALIEDQTQNGYTPIKNPKFELYTDKNGEYRFRLKLANGQIIIHSEGYKSREMCIKGIEEAKKSAYSNDIETV